MATVVKHRVYYNTFRYSDLSGPAQSHDRTFVSESCETLRAHFQSWRDARNEDRGRNDRHTGPMVAAFHEDGTKCNEY